MFDYWVLTPSRTKHQLPVDLPRRYKNAQKILNASDARFIATIITSEARIHKLEYLNQ